MGIFDMSGKTVIVTAGVSYLGRAVAEALAEFGANLAVTSRDPDKARTAANRLAQAYGVKTLGLAMNLDDGESVERMFQSVLAEFGGLDVLVNNASYSRPSDVTQMTPEDWAAGLSGTVGGVFRTTKAALGIMLPQGRGNIINISSMYGAVAPDPGVYGDIPPNPANYGAGKAAVIQFTKYIACAYGAQGIRANCICPGAFPNNQEPDFVSRLAAKTPLRRVGRPEDLKGVAVLLASDAGGYITGQNYIVDGGWTAW